VSYFGNTPEERDAFWYGAAEGYLFGISAGAVAWALVAFYRWLSQ
jgi:hypothetical protein